MRMRTGALACLPPALLAPRTLLGDSKLGDTCMGKEGFGQGVLLGACPDPKPGLTALEAPHGPGGTEG